MFPQFYRRNHSAQSGFAVFIFMLFMPIQSENTVFLTSSECVITFRGSGFDDPTDGRVSL